MLEIGRVRREAGHGFQAARAAAACVLFAATLVTSAHAEQPRRTQRSGTASPTVPASPAPAHRPKVSIGERLAQLDHWNPRVRQIAAEALAAYGDDARRIAVSSLLGSLHDVDPGVRRAAAQTIGLLEPPWWAVSDGLVDALGDVDDLVRHTVIEQVAARGDTPVPQLVTALDAPVVRRREGAALTLGSIGPLASAARDRLRLALTDPNKDVQHAARGALDAIGEPPPPPPAPVPTTAPLAPPASPGHTTWLVLPLPAGWAAAAWSGAGAALATVWLVARGRRRVRAARRERAGRAPKPATSAESLGVAEIRRALDKNLVRLRDPDGERRFAGVQGLAELGARAVPSLVQALQDTDPEVRYWAVATLEQIGPAASAAVPMLADLVASATEREETRGYATHALTRIGVRAMPGALILLRSDRVETRRHAASIFHRLGAEAEASAAHLVAALDDPDGEVSSTVEEALACMSGAVAPQLASALAHDRAAVRARAARILRRVGAGTPEALNALAHACTDPDPEVQHEAVLSLEALQPPTPTLDGGNPPGDVDPSTSNSGMMN